MSTEDIDPPICPILALYIMLIICFRTSMDVARSRSMESNLSSPQAMMTLTPIAAISRTTAGSIPSSVMR